MNAEIPTNEELSQELERLADELRHGNDSTLRLSAARLREADAARADAERFQAWLDAPGGVSLAREAEDRWWCEVADESEPYLCARGDTARAAFDQVVNRRRGQ